MRISRAILFRRLVGRSERDSESRERAAGWAAVRFSLCSVPETMERTMCIYTRSQWNRGNGSKMAQREMKKEKKKKKKKSFTHALVNILATVTPAGI